MREGRFASIGTIPGEINPYSAHTRAVCLDSLAG
jgi:hypothetical protein